MRRYISLLIMVIVVACASGPTTQINQTLITFTGGNFHDKSWDDSLKFHRTSWYLGATLVYDLWLAKVDKDSPFTYWMGSNRENNLKCREFYIGLFYAYTYSIQIKLESPTYIKNQIRELGYDDVALTHMSSYLSTHRVFQQWNLKFHKLSGFCYNKLTPPPKEMYINMPGFKSVNVLK